MRVVVVALPVVLAAISGCHARGPALGGFAGGFDPTHWDAGPLPAAPKGVLGRPLRLDVPPFYADKIAAGAQQELEKYLEDETRLDVDIRAPAAYDFAAIKDGLRTGEIDVAELTPYQFALLDGESTKVVPLAATVAHGASTYGSYLVARQGSRIHGIADLKGKKIAFVDPLSTSGWLLPALYLQDHGFDLRKDVHVVWAGTHPAALQMVESGAVDAAAVSSDLLVGNAGLAGPLVAVAKAGRMPYDVLVARADLDPRVLTLVKSALYRLSIHDARGRRALRAFSAVDGFMPVPPGHYDGVKALAKRARSLSLGGAVASPSPAPPESLPPVGGGATPKP